MCFSGKSVLITGAAAGIGRATAITFAQKGAKLVIVDANSEYLEKVKMKSRLLVLKFWRTLVMSAMRIGEMKFAKMHLKNLVKLTY